MPVTVAASARIAVPGGLFSIAARDGTVWVNTSSGAVRIDAATNLIVATVKFGSGADEMGGIAASAGAVWAADFDTSTVYRIDPKTNTVVAQIPVGKNPEGVVASEDAIWVANHRGGSVSRIDPKTNTVTATISVSSEGPSGPQGIALGLGSLWVTSPNIGSVIRIDATTNQVLAKIPVPARTFACGGMVATPTAVWMSSCGEAAFDARIDPASNIAVATVYVGNYSSDPWVVEGRGWFAVDAGGKFEDGTLVRVDPASNAVTRVLSIGAPLTSGGSVVLGDSVWLTDGSGDGQVLRFPLTAMATP